MNMMPPVSDLAPETTHGSGQVARARLARMAPRTPPRPADPLTTGQLFLRVFDARRRLVDPEQPLLPGRYRISAAPAFAVTRFSWSQNGALLPQQHDGEFTLDLRRGETLVVRVVAHAGAYDDAAASAELRLEAEAVEDSVDIVLFDLRGHPLDPRRPLSPGVYRLAARGDAVERCRRTWRVNGEPWGDGSDIAVPLPLGARERRRGVTDVEFGLHDEEGMIESVRVRLTLASAYRFDPWGWVLRQMVTFAALLTLFGLGALLFAHDTLPPGLSVALSSLAALVTGVGFWRWRQRGRPERTEYGAMLWPALLGGGLTLLLLSTGSDRLTTLFWPSVLLSVAGVWTLVGWANVVRPSAIAMRREFGAFGMMLLAVMIPTTLLDLSIPARAALLALAVAFAFALGWFGYVAEADALDDERYDEVN